MVAPSCLYMEVDGKHTANAGRRERAADASTSGGGNEVLRSPGAGRRSLSPRNWQQQQQQPPSAAARKLVAAAAGSAAGAARSATPSAGQKQRLSGAATAAGPSSHSGERSDYGELHAPML